MGIVGGLDIHRRQITFNYLDTDSGEVARGKIAPADRQHVRRGSGASQGRADVAFALEGCTGMALRRRGARADRGPGPSGRAGRYGQGARAASSGPRPTTPTPRLLRELLAMGRLPESWIPPEHVLEVRARVRLYKALADERRGWMQRIRATLFHQGVPALACSPARCGGPGPSRAGELSRSGRESVEVALGQIERLDTELARLRADWWPSPTARSGAGPCRATTGSVLCSRWPFGRRWATAGVSAPPPTPCATPAST